MPKFIAKLVQRSAAFCEVEVEAATQEEANEKAEEILAHAPDNILAFGKDEVEGHDVLWVEEVNDA